MATISAPIYPSLQGAAHRLQEQQEAEWGVKIYRTAEDLAHEKAEEEGEPTDDVNFAGGGNGIRLVFDLQSWKRFPQRALLTCEDSKLE